MSPPLCPSCSSPLPLAHPKSVITCPGCGKEIDGSEVFTTKIDAETPRTPSAIDHEGAAIAAWCAPDGNGYKMASRDSWGTATEWMRETKRREVGAVLDHVGHAALVQENARLREELAGERFKVTDQAAEIAHLKRAIDSALDGLNAMPDTREKMGISSDLIRARLVR